MKCLLVVLFVALPAVAEEEFVEIPGLQCRGNLCVIPREVLNTMIETHNSHIDEIAALKAEKKTVECARVDVTEPSKNIKKPLPFIKRENDS